ncbi:hypothetical protein SELMODRAFT_418142 [Selaginella moellendorffii]|uniref:OVATE domain-containing protein n=1 Tax=Selaginella moellendorffii TaxID=88036 RepID=D8S4T6_SELML|nr:hypothetical protein SELMODRAFT_418142 [Selaginella moellendorffii]
MAKLRFKLSSSQRHSKSTKLHGKMAASRASSPPSQQRQQQQDQGLPRIPYIRCGFLQGKPPKVLPTSTDEQHKLPQSPVNRKAADITFPARPGASVPVTPLPKKWLTLGCDPCKQHTSLMHEDYKLSVAAIHRPELYDNAGSRVRQRRRKHRSKLGTSSSSVTPVTCSPVADEARFPASSSSPAAVHNREDWQPEMRWKVVARSENKVVQRQVVLQKKLSVSSSLKQQQPQQQESKLKKMMMSDAGFATLAESPIANFKPGTEEAMYKLMTTSPDQSMENDTSYAWEKDLSPFASESSIFNSFDSPNNLNRSAGNRICVSPQHRKTLMSSRCLGSNSSGSSSGSGVFKLVSPGSERRQSRFHWSVSPPLAPGQFDDHQAFHNDPEALSKAWERSRFCLSADEEAGEQGVQAHYRTELESPPIHLSIEEHDTNRLKRTELSQAFTSRVMESFAVEKASVNPYRDFRESMVEMILKKDLFHCRDLEELLRTYLMLNNEKFHDLIIRVFTDLWHQLYSNNSS